MESWVADRKARKKPVTEEGAWRQLQQVGYLAEGHQPGVVIANSIAGSYQGLFQFNHFKNHHNTCGLLRPEKSKPRAKSGAFRLSLRMDCAVRDSDTSPGLQSRKPTNRRNTC